MPLQIARALLLPPPGPVWARDAEAHLRRDIGLPETDRADAALSRTLTALRQW